MLKKVGLLIMVVVLLGGIGILLIPKEGKSQIENGNLESSKDNSKVSSNTNNKNERMVHIEPGKIR